MTQVNLSMKQRQTHRQNRRVAAKGSGGCGGLGVWGYQIETIACRMDKPDTPI